MENKKCILVLFEQTKHINAFMPLKQNLKYILQQRAVCRDSKTSVFYSDFSSILNEIYDGVSNLFHREWSYHWLRSCPFIFVASCFKHGSFYRKISLSCCQFYIRTDRSHGLGIFLSGLVLRRSLWKQNFLIWHTDENVIYC